LTQDPGIFRKRKKQGTWGKYIFIERIGIDEKVLPMTTLIR